MKTFLAVVGIVMSLTAPLPYIKNIVKKKNRPHIITWLIWSVIATAGFILQLIGGGGLGSYVLGATAFMNVIIFLLCLRLSKDHVTNFDMTILFLALVAVVLWLATDNPELAVIMIAIATLLGSVPTYKNSLVSENETASLFVISGIKQLIGIVSLSAYNLLTLLLPIVFFLNNLVIVLIIKRHWIKK